MWNFKEIDFICRLVSDENEKFKFDLLLRNNVIVTDGKTYDNFTEASNALRDFLDKMYDYEQNFDSLHSKSHLVINDII